MNDSLVIGVDLGGTKIASALVDHNGGVLATRNAPTDVASGTRAVLDRIAGEINALAGEAEGRVIGVGIGSPGLVNADAGVVMEAVNLKWDRVELASEVRRRLKNDVLVSIEKDANAGVLGELYFGAGRDCTDLVLLTIGTGFGAGFIAGGRLISGAHWAASDLGHLSLDPTGRPCPCGAKGCIETTLSGSGLLAVARELHAGGRYPTHLGDPAGWNPRQVLTAARAGDPLATAVLDEQARVLAVAVAICAVALDPQTIIVGGGLGEAAFDLLLPRTREHLGGHLTPNRKKPQIVPSRVQSSAVGAAAIALARNETAG